MPKTAKRRRKQAQNKKASPLPTASLVQLLLPMVTGMMTTRQDLMTWVHERGLDALGDALMLDGIEVAKQTLIVALGITATGDKIPLGLEQGSTENAALCTTLLNGLIDRGLKVSERILCVIDGGKGIRKALEDVFGNLAVIQRCTVHKRRNVREHLSPAHVAYVMSATNEAYKSATADTARKRLRQLVSWLESNGEEAAAKSLREGMEETLTVNKLALPATLRSSLSTTNMVENVNGSIRRVTRNVKRWGGSDMRRRWVGLAISEASKHFHRIKGYRDLPLLIRALRQQNTVLDAKQEAA